MRRGAEDERDTGINRKWEVLATSVTKFLALVSSTRNYRHDNPRRRQGYCETKCFFKGEFPAVADLQVGVGCDSNTIGDLKNANLPSKFPAACLFAL